jgi:hypothetical protein
VFGLRPNDQSRLVVRERLGAQRVGELWREGGAVALHDEFDGVI